MLISTKMLFLKLKDKEKLLEYHLYDLKKFLISSFIIFFIIFFINIYFTQQLVSIFEQPLLKVLKNKNLSDNPFIVTSLPEGFISYIKIIFYISMLLFIPILMWQIVNYLLPTLHKNIRKEVVIIIAILAPSLFYIGAVIAYFFTFHFVWNFLVNFNLNKNLGLYLKISEYISLALNIILWSGISFQLPVVIYLLFRLGIVSYEKFKNFRKLAILLAFIIAAVATPPDPFSQIIMALVLILLYEVTLIVIKKMNKTIVK